MAKQFKGEIKLDIRESTPDWSAFLPNRAPEGAPNVFVVLYDDTGLAAWSPYGGQHQHADDRPPGRKWPDVLPVAHDRTVLADSLDVPHRPQPSPERLRYDLRVVDRLSRLQLAHPARERTMATVLREAGWTHVLGRQESQHPGRRVHEGFVEEGVAVGTQATTVSTASSAARRTTGIPTSPRTTTTSTSRTSPRTATTCPRTSPTRPSSSSAIRSSPSRTSRGTCGSAPVPTTRRTTPRRSTSTSTRGCSTTATRPTASGCCRG